jgi:aspartate aminotransferase-like enzyme
MHHFVGKVPARSAGRRRRLCAPRHARGARRGSPRSYSLDLLRHHDQLEANSQTPFTPAVPLFVALERAIEALLEKGVAERRRSYLRRRAFLAARLRRLGLPLLRLPAGTEACSILTVGVPRPLDLDALYWSRCEQGYVIYRAKAPLAPDYFQLGVMGELSEADPSGFLEGLESLLVRPAGRLPRRDGVARSTQKRRRRAADVRPGH